MLGDVLTLKRVCKAVAAVIVSLPPFISVRETNLHDQCRCVWECVTIYVALLCGHFRTDEAEWSVDGNRRNCHCAISSLRRILRIDRRSGFNRRILTITWSTFSSEKNSSWRRRTTLYLSAKKKISFATNKYLSAALYFRRCLMTIGNGWNWVRSRFHTQTRKQNGRSINPLSHLVLPAKLPICSRR